MVVHPQRRRCEATLVEMGEILSDQAGVELRQQAVAQKLDKTVEDPSVEIEGFLRTSFDTGHEGKLLNGLGEGRNRLRGVRPLWAIFRQFHNLRVRALVSEILLTRSGFCSFWWALEDSNL